MHKNTSHHEMFILSIYGLRISCKTKNISSSSEGSCVAVYYYLFIYLSNNFNIHDGETFSILLFVVVI